MVLSQSVSCFLFRYPRALEELLNSGLKKLNTFRLYFIDGKLQVPTWRADSRHLPNLPPLSPGILSNERGKDAPACSWISL